MKSLPNSGSRTLQAGVLVLMVFAFLGASDEGARFNSLGHKLMCVCGCSQILLECNHVGCTYPTACAVSSWQDSIAAKTTI